MKTICFAVVLLTLPLIMQAQASNTLMFRQDIARSATFYWLHNEKSWGSELLYCTGDNPKIVLGATPYFQAKFGAVGIMVSNYFTSKFDASKAKWPLYFVGLDNFTTLNFKDWVLLVRTTPDFNLVKKEAQYSGRDYVGLKLSEGWQIQIQAEWTYVDRKLSQTFGFGWVHNLTDKVGLDGYLGIEIKKPYQKVGWFALRCTTK